MTNFRARPHFEDRQIQQSVGESITLSGQTNFDLGNYNGYVYDSYEGFVTGVSGVTFSSVPFSASTDPLIGWSNQTMYQPSILRVKPPRKISFSGNTDTISSITQVDVTNYVLTSVDSGGTVAWKPVVFSANTCLPELITTNISPCDSGGTVTLDGNFTILGNFIVSGITSASTTIIQTEIVRVEDNNMELNYGGNHTTSIGGGITVLSGQSNTLDSKIYTNNEGVWSFDPSIYSPIFSGDTYYTNSVNFNTNPTIPTITGGTLYFDVDENALSYKPITNNNDVTINIGQESLIRVYNDTGVQINNGQVLTITGATGGVPTVSLANASKLGTTVYDSLAQTNGVSTHNIPNGEYGFMTDFGIVRDFNTSGYTVGGEVFLSDIIDGGLTSDPNSISFTSRLSTVGVCLESHPTNGKILVRINNENPLQSLTQKQVNILLGNTVSTGVYTFSGITSASTTTVNVSPVNGWVVYNTYDRALEPLVVNVNYSGGTNITLPNLTTSDETYFLVNSGSTIFQQTTYPTPQERRQNIFLGKVNHPNRTNVDFINNDTDFDVSPMSALRDLWSSIKLINNGVIISPNGSNLNINTSSGTLWGNGIGWVGNQLNPDSVTINATSPTTFQYRVQTGGTFSDTNTIDVANYDLAGVVTPVGGGSNASTNQRVFLFPSGRVRIQYGQKVYNSLTEAVAGSQTESFITYSNNQENGVLIGIISVNKNATQLNNTTQAVFSFVSKFGEALGGTGGLSTTTLQQTYNNSTTPEITTNSSLGALSIKNGTGNPDNTSKIIEGVNSTNNITSIIRADGYISGTTLQTNGFKANLNGVSATTVNIGSLGGGSSVNNLGIDSSGNVVIGLTGNTLQQVLINGNQSLGSNIILGTDKIVNTTGNTHSIFFSEGTINLWNDYSADREGRLFLNNGPSISYLYNRAYVGANYTEGKLAFSDSSTKLNVFDDSTGAEAFISQDLSGGYPTQIINTTDISGRTSGIYMDSTGVLDLIVDDGVDTGGISITPGSILITTTDGTGVEYDVDYSSNYTNRSLVDKEYVDGEITTNSLFTGGTGTNSIKAISDGTNDLVHIIE
jgi:hypothetical protein